MNVSRKRSVLTEKILLPNDLEVPVPHDFFHILGVSEALYQNRFIAVLEHAGGVFNPERIKGFKVVETGTERTLLITSILHINEWVDDFKVITIAKILLLDSKSKPSRLLDFDVAYAGYSLSGDYGNATYMEPVITYRILG